MYVLYGNIYLLYLLIRLKIYIFFSDGKVELSVRFFKPISVHTLSTPWLVDYNSERRSLKFAFDEVTFIICGRLLK